jgi:hypothetical protein
MERVQEGNGRASQRLVNFQQISARPINRIDFFGKSELFLKQFMGEKVRAEEGLSLTLNVEGATAQVRVVGTPLG